MDALMKYAVAHPVTAMAIAAAVIVGLYLLLNLKPTATKDAERRVKELREASRDRYRDVRPPR